MCVKKKIIIPYIKSFTDKTSRHIARRHLRARATGTWRSLVAGGGGASGQAGGRDKVDRAAPAGVVEPTTPPSRPAGPAERSPMRCKKAPSRCGFTGHFLLSSRPPDDWSVTSSSRCASSARPSG